MSDTIDAQLKKGVLELCVLELLSHGESYAYEIASRMADAIGMGEGTVYPLMRRLHVEGLVETHLVESPSGPPRKYYRITRSGRMSSSRSKNSNSTPVALREYRLKLTPPSTTVAPRGALWPGCCMSQAPQLSAPRLGKPEHLEDVEVPRGHVEIKSP